MIAHAGRDGAADRLRPEVARLKVADEPSRQPGEHAQRSMRYSAFSAAAAAPPRPHPRREGAARAVRSRQFYEIGSKARSRLAVNG